MMYFPSPDEANYVANESVMAFNQTNTIGGRPKSRKGLVDTWQYINCSWTCTNDELDALEKRYAYFAFFPNPFDIDIVLADGLKTYSAVFVPETKTISSPRGNVYTFSAMLRAKEMTDIPPVAPT